MIQNMDKKQVKNVTESYNQKSTTVRMLDTLSRSQAYTKCTQIIKHNLQALHKQLEWVSEQPDPLKMKRIGSELVPVATHDKYKWIYQDSDVQELLSSELHRIGKFAREHNIRMSFHPGQFCILNSINDDIIQRSVEEFEYHTDLAKMMGYGSSFHDHGFAINIHAGSKIGGLHRLVSTINNCLSQEARNLITIENDEFSWGIDQLLEIAHHTAIVLDLHHHLIATGEYIQANDSRIEHIIQSWRGVRPLGHLSTSREDVIAHLVPHDQLPDINYTMQQHGIPKSKLRAHSHMCWNQAVNDWAITHLSWMDIEVEAKSKNLASCQLFEQAKTKQFVFDKQSFSY
jgi:UV DNA damage repair endonuclease